MKVRKLTTVDAQHVHALIKACPPLDLNSLYVYLLLGEHYSQTCVVAEDDDSLVGFTSAYLVPQRPETLFIWQVAVHETCRGAGLGGWMLRSLLARPELAAIRYIETTVSPSNAGSRKMFAALASFLKVDITESDFFNQDYFGAQVHEEERLLRLGPFRLDAALGQSQH